MDEKYHNDAQTAKIVYDYAFEKYKMQHQYFDSINTKNSLVLSLITLSFTSIIGFIAYIYKEYYRIINLNNCISMVFIIGMITIVILLILSFWKSLDVLNIKEMADAMRVEKLILHAKQNNGETLKKEKTLYILMARSLSAAENTIIKTNLNQSENLTYVIKILRVLLILIVFELSLFLYLIK